MNTRDKHEVAAIINLILIRLGKMGLGLKKVEKKIEIVNVRPDTTGDRR